MWETKEYILGCQNRRVVAKNRKKVHSSITINKIISNLLENMKCACSYDFPGGMFLWLLVFSFLNNVNGPRDWHTEWSQKEEKKYCILAHLWNLGKNVMLLLFFFFFCCCSLVTKSCLTLATPWTWTIALQVPLSMGFPRQEYWSGLSFPSPEDLPYPGIKPITPAWQADSLPLSHQGSPQSGIDDPIPKAEIETQT